MNANLVLNVIRMIYVSMLRKALIQKVKDSESKVDDVVIEILDRLLKIEEDEKN